MLIRPPLAWGKQTSQSGAVPDGQGRRERHARKQKSRGRWHRARPADHMDRRNRVLQRLGRRLHRQPSTSPVRGHQQRELRGFAFDCRQPSLYATSCESAARSSWPLDSGKRARDGQCELAPSFRRLFGRGGPKIRTENMPRNAGHALDIWHSFGRNLAVDPTRHAGFVDA